jgi:hypothetical protein
MEPEWIPEWTPKERLQFLCFLVSWPVLVFTRSISAVGKKFVGSAIGCYLVGRVGNFWGIFG